MNSECNVMNLEYIKVSLFEISYKNIYIFFHDIQIFWDAPVYVVVGKIICLTFFMCFNVS